tara:strand:+ start:560 stop:1261 length:702 start_codon:yes stop_codon:yes gene_type:complete
LIALLLAAGTGTRLRPITDKVPKCLIPINDKAIIDYWIEDLVELNFKKIIINTHYLSAKVEEHLKNSIYFDRIKIIYEPVLLGTGGTLKNFSKSFHDKESMTLVAHVDNYYEENLINLMNHYKTKPKYCLMTMMTFEITEPIKFGVIEKNNEGVMTNFYEKKNVRFTEANCAVYCLDPRIFKSNYITKDLNDISLDLIPKLINKINIFKTNKFFIDIGSHENLNIINKRFKRS